MGRSWARDRADGREYLEAESNGLRSKGNEGGHLSGALADLLLWGSPAMRGSPIVALNLEILGYWEAERMVGS